MGHPSHLISPARGQRLSLWAACWATITNRQGWPLCWQTNSPSIILTGVDMEPAGIRLPMPLSARSKTLMLSSRGWWQGVCLWHVRSRCVVPGSRSARPGPQDEETCNLGAALFREQQPPSSAIPYAHRETIAGQPHNVADEAMAPILTEYFQ